MFCSFIVHTILHRSEIVTLMLDRAHVVILLHRRRRWHIVLLWWSNTLYLLIFALQDDVIWVRRGFLLLWKWKREREKTMFWSYNVRIFILLLELLMIWRRDSRIRIPTAIKRLRLNARGVKSELVRTTRAVIKIHLFKAHVNSTD